MTRPRTPPIRVAYAYRVPFLPRSCTESRAASFAAETDISFPVVVPDEAPVAFRIAAPQARSYGRNPFKPKADGSARSVLWHGNGFWLEWGPVGDMERLLQEQSDTTETPFANDVDVRPFGTSDVRDDRGRLAKSPKGIQTMEGLRRREGVIKTIEDDGGVERGMAIRAVADRCIVVDGVLYEETPEPCLEVDSYWEGITVTPVPDANRSLTFGCSHAMGGRNRYFRLDALDEALAASREAASKKPAAPPVIEILRPDLVGAEPDLGHTMREANALLQKVKGIAGHLPRGWIGKAAAFARVLDEAPRFPTPALADAVEALAALPPSPEPPIRRVPLGPYDRDDRARAFAELPNIVSLAAAMAPLAREMATLHDAFPDRLDTSVCTRTRSDGPEVRLRQARTPEDLRRAATALGQPVERLVRRLEDDADLDVVLAEGGLMFQAGKDMPLKAVRLIDLSTGSVIEESGELDPGLLERHLDAARPGPSPAFAMPGAA